MFGLNMQTEEGRILCKYVPNYRINLVDAGNISDLGRFHTDLQQILGVLKYRQDKKELKDYIYENRDYFAGVDVETYQALRAFLHSENMLKDFSSTMGLVKAVDIHIREYKIFLRFTSGIF